MAKYFRLTATSIIRYEHYIKVPDSFTKEDIWELEGKDHRMYDGDMFSEVKYSGDWEFDDVYEYMMDEQDPMECYKWEYSQIKGGYETDWHADEDCITPRGEPL